MKYLFWFLLLSVFVFRYLSTLPVYKQGDHLKIETTLLTEPVVYDTSLYFKIKGLKVYLPKSTEVGYGDKITIEGIVEEDKLKNPKIIEIKKTSNFLFNIRSKIISFYTSNLPATHASLIAGVTLGSKQNIPHDFWEKLKSTGTAHIVVASGTNVVLVGGFILSTMTNFMVRKKALFVACLGIWIYTLISGLDAPLVRAAIMGTIAFTAQELGRVNESRRILFITAFIMLIISPSWISDIGFILSFAATLSLILFQSQVDRLISFVPGIIRQDLSTTLAAQIGVAPIIFFTFGQFNIFSPFINVLVLWTIPLITMIGMFSGLIALIVPQVGRLILLIVYPLTWFFITVVNWLG